MVKVNSQEAWNSWVAPEGNTAIPVNLKKINKKNKKKPLHLQCLMIPQIDSPN